MVNPVAFSLFGKEIYWYGIVMSIAIFAAVLLGLYNARKRGFHPDMIVDFCLLAIPLALVFARIYYCVFAWDEFAANPMRVFYIWEGGIAIYGSLIGGLIAGFIFCKWRKVSMWDLMDIAAPSLILGQALGRWGNYFNQEVYGVQVTNPAWQLFPIAVYIQKSDVTGWFYALFFYEFVWNLAVFGVLYLYRRVAKPRGNTFFLYMMLYALGRMGMEAMREAQYALTIGGSHLRVSLLLSAVLLVGCGLAMFLRRNAVKTDYLPEGPYVYDTYMAHAKEKQAEKDNGGDKEHNA